jgi:hypothetical protein
MQDVDARLRAAREAGKTIVSDPTPEYDQLTEYVYQADLAESDTEARVVLAVGKVGPKTGRPPAGRPGVPTLTATKTAKAGKKVTK